MARARSREGIYTVTFIASTYTGTVSLEYYECFRRTIRRETSPSTGWLYIAPNCHPPLSTLFTQVVWEPGRLT